MSPTLTCPDCTFSGEGSGATALSGIRGTITTLGLMQALKPACICLLHVHWTKEDFCLPGKAEELLIIWACALQVMAMSQIRLCSMRTQASAMPVCSSISS